MILAYNEFISKKRPFSGLKWKWNPEAPLRASIPDMQGVKGGKVKVSVIVIGSRPLDGQTRGMLNLYCRRLEAMEGRRFLVVAEDRLKVVAEEVIQAEKYRIEVICLRMRPILPRKFPTPPRRQFLSHQIPTVPAKFCLTGVLALMPNDGEARIMA